MILVKDKDKEKRERQGNVLDRVNPNACGRAGLV